MSYLESRLAQIKALAERATPGPWTTGEDGGGTRALFWESPWHGRENFAKFFWPGHPPEATKQIEDWWEGAEDFIASARTDVPALVAALEFAVGALEAVSNGHTVFELAEDQSGFSGDIVKTEMKKLITPETDKARQALTQIGAALGIEEGK